MNLGSFDALQQVLSEDEKQKDARIARFINVENLEMWCSVKNMLASKCDNCIQVSHFCLDDDRTPNLNRMLKALGEINSSALLVPLSEHLRINRNDEILSQIAHMDFVRLQESHHRLYVLLYRTRPALNALLGLDTRLADKVFFVQDGAKDDYSLIILPKDLLANFSGNHLEGYKRYLAYWESNPSMPIILHTDNVQFYQDYTFADDVKVITSAYETLRHQGIIDSAVDRSWGEDWCWRKVLSKLPAGGDLSTIVRLLLGKNELAAVGLLSEWTRQDDFGKWLTWLWLKLHADGLYLRSVLSNCDTYTEFISLIASRIFEFDPSDKQYRSIYEERKRYLAALNIETLPSAFWTMLSATDDPERLYRLTDRSRRERETIIELFPVVFGQRQTREFLGLAYPKLAHYLDSYVFKDPSLTKYFDEYKTHKLRNQFSSDFLRQVDEFASVKGIWWQLGIESRNKIVDRYCTNKTKIIWLDALGAEFLGLIETMLRENYPSCRSLVAVGYSVIPTITETNSDFVEGRNFQYCKELDDLVHNGKFPGYISDQINVVSSQLSLAVACLDEFDRVIITADHGASRGVVLGKGITVKASDESSVERGGRFCVDKSAKYEATCACIDAGDYHVFANYDRFSVSGSPRNENHGGATLEEVLVPVVVLSRIPLDDNVHVELLTPEVRMRLGKARVEFKIDRDFPQVFANVDSHRYECVKQGDRWYFEAQCDRRTEYVARITSDRTIATLAYKVNKGRTDNKDFDI